MPDTVLTLMIMISKAHLRPSQAGWEDIRSNCYEYMLTQNTLGAPRLCFMEAGSIKEAFGEKVSISLVN